MEFIGQLVFTAAEITIVLIAACARIHWLCATFDGVKVP
jgi:hypothetical protein